METTVMNNLIGIWSLQKYLVEIQSTGQKNYPMGMNPTGYAAFFDTGKVMVTLTGETRMPAQNDSECASLMKTLVAYAGSYRVEGEEWVTTVEVAWNPEWVGTEQRRFFVISGDNINVTTAWRVMPNWQDMGMQRSILTFTRVRG
jgi:hypothetical protein